MTGSSDNTCKTKLNKIIVSCKMYDKFKNFLNLTYYIIFPYYSNGI